jgi:precorrin-6B methylase 2
MADAHPDPSHILQIGMGFFASKTLLSAVELGLFEVLGDGKLTGEEVRTRLGLHSRAAADFLDALVALHLLAREGDGPDALYANTQDTATFLNPGSPAYLGGILHMANQRLYPFWGHLTEALRTGMQQNEAKHGGDLFGAIYADPARLEGFLAAMAGIQKGNFAVLADRFDFSRHHVVCDVGGASGALCIAVARQHPHLRCITYDLPQVAPVARRNVAAAGLAERIEVRSGDFMEGALPEADVIVMANILHDWGSATKRMLIGKAHAALPEGGAFVAVENIIDDARRQNVFGLLMSLNMLIETSEGYDYTFAAFEGWCRDAGFRSTERVALVGPASAALAWK